MTITAISVSGWCDLEDCQMGPRPLSGVAIGEVQVCTSCLIRLGGGVSMEEFAVEERRVEELQRTLDKCEEQVETLQRRLEERKGLDDGR